MSIEDKPLPSVYENREKAIKGSGYRFTIGYVDKQIASMSSGLQEPEESEQAVIAGVLHYPSIRQDLFNALEEQDFYISKYGAVFAITKEMDSKGYEITPSLVYNYLKGKKEYQYLFSNEFTGLQEYELEELNMKWVLGASAASYAIIVKDFSQKRRMIQCFIDSAQYAMSGMSVTADDVRAYHDSIMNNISYLEDESEKEDTDSLDDVYSDIVSKEGEVVYSTGFSSLDSLLDGGLRPKQVMVVGARPGTGKSMLGLAIADSLAKQGKHTFFLTIEMTAKEMSQRRLAFTSRVPLSVIRGKDNISGLALHMIQDACNTIKGYTGRIHFNERALSPSSIRLNCKKYKNREELDAIVIDYLQIVKPDNMKADTQAQVIGEIAYALKAIAKEFNVPIIALAQLNREVGKRGGKPMVSDLRDSGMIEQMADIVLLMHREEDNASKHANIELIVGKNRSGRTGSISLVCQKNIMLLMDPNGTANS